MQLELDDYEEKLLHDIIGDHIGIERKFNQELREDVSPDNQIPIMASDKRLRTLMILRSRL